MRKFAILNLWSASVGQVQYSHPNEGFDEHAIMGMGRGAATGSNFQCWTCGDQSSYGNCFVNGRFDACSANENARCFIEIRKNNNKIRITTGCQTVTGCEDLKKQNFVGPFKVRTQCKPENSGMYGRRYGESTCRQCFNTCDELEDPTKCFSPAGTHLGIPQWDDLNTYWDPLTELSRTFWSDDLSALQDDK